MSRRISSHTLAFPADPTRHREEHSMNQPKRNEQANPLHSTPKQRRRTGAWEIVPTKTSLLNRSRMLIPLTHQLKTHTSFQHITSLLLAMLAALSPLPASGRPAACVALRRLAAPLRSFASRRWAEEVAPPEGLKARQAIAGFMQAWKQNSVRVA